MNAPIIRLRVLPAIPPINGREIEFRVTDTHIQQRLAGDAWEDLIALSEIVGPVGDTPTFRLQGGFVQWKPTLAPDTAWTNIIPLADITGPQGLQGLQGIQGPPGPTTPDDGSVTDAKFSSSVYAIPNDPTADLRTFMDMRYGVGQWTGRTGVGVGSDVGPAMDDAFDALRSRYGRGILRIPPGHWMQKTPVTPSKLLGHVVKGCGGFGASTITFDAVGSQGMFYFNTLVAGSGEYSGGGLEDLTLFLEEGLGDANNFCIRLAGDTTYMPSRTIFNNLNITARGTSYWGNGFFAEGTTRTAPQGIRHVNISNMTIFSCWNRGFFARNAVQWEVRNSSVHTSKGDGRKFELGGLATADTNSIQVFLQGINSEIVQITNASRVFGYVTCGTFITATTWTNSRIEGTYTTLSGGAGTGAQFINAV